VKREDLRVGLCTAPDAESGLKLARTLVEERLAACVNVIPRVVSVYRWQGEIEQNDEVLLIIKTAATVDLEKMKDRLLTVHPYDVPELLLLPVSYGLDKYLDWIAQSMGPPGGSHG
jgi:periplasmic divalent cation tolerance protein